MIFYFTGTGNSLMAAKALAKDGESLVSIAEAHKSGNYFFDLPTGERLGFVFPVYFYTLPDVVRDFVDKLDIGNADYVFSVITCGGGIGNAGACLARALEKKGLALDYVVPLVMPDNAVLYYDLDPKEKTDMYLRNAEVRLNTVRTELDTKTVRKAEGRANGLFRAVYRSMTKTRAFYTTDACIGCGLCAENCPDSAIEMLNNRPLWTKKTCIKCTACINRCPVSAIQHGRKTEKRRRYVNPILKSE